MKNRARFQFAQAVVLPLCASVAFAQAAGGPGRTVELGPAPQQVAQPQPQAVPVAAQPAQQQVFSQEQIDQMLAPIALYPDALLSQILMASTYPIEVVQAARWSKANPGLSGDAAVKAVEQQSWDPSVKSLVAFPNVLAMMDEKLDWMEDLGDAFLSQQQQVMDSVQQLRQKAMAAGNLKSNDNIRVQPQGQSIVIEQANPQVVYVPYYDPMVIYGPWWYPAYPPVFWRPWPGYYAYPAWGSGFYWGSGIVVGAGFFFGGCDWPRRHVTVVNVNNHYYRPVPPPPHVPPGVWAHDPVHRHGVPYRDPVLSREYGHPRHYGGRPEFRRDFRGSPPRPGSATLGPQPRPAPARPADAPDFRQRASRPDGAPVPRFTPGRPIAPSAGMPGADTPRRNFSDRRLAAPAQPRPQAGRAMTAPPRPANEARPRAFGGVGQRPVMRNQDPRNYASAGRAVPSGPVARPQGPMPAPRSAGAVRPSRPAHQSHHGNGRPRN
ncbi:MAG TPA: DUF3300 domain-containing protein [Burkholderiales bacterium]|nr:DUF3300 domain-containing protein [Burkholderiales bacterium]